MKSVVNGSDADEIDQYEIMKSYLTFGNGFKIIIFHKHMFLITITHIGYGIDKMMEFHVEKSDQPTYYLRYLFIIHAKMTMYSGEE